ncbi:MAG TPA: enoyl-CoA hydratase-related protein [Candidatus Sulfomarinibacteraceae bacterium]|nr:enoyl-CoA hydratase-related protein [Candidatus Sulfomarinibacteraceae bacterium]
MSELIGLELGRVAHLELVNPPLNLVTRELTEQLRDALAKLASAHEVRAVVVSGRGERAFCAGSHIGEFEGLRGRVAEGKLLLEKLVYRQLAELPMPTIAAIEGDALGGGLELALCCDLRVASARARLGMPEVRLAVLPGSGGTQRLPRVVGPARAKELILTGRIISAEEAERIGLVNRVVPAGEARAAADELAAEIAARGPLAVREAKRLIDAAPDLGLDAGLAAELDASERIFDSEDMLEGARAFFGKRDPEYRGR